MRSIDHRTDRFLRLPAGLLGAATVLLTAALAVAAPADGGRLPVQKMSWEQIRALPDGPQIIDRELTRQRIYQERWHQVHDLLGGQHVSSLSRQRLAEEGLGSARLASPTAALAKAGVDTLRILLIRIAFAENRDPQLATMAPDGDFFFEPRDTHPVLQIDPEPHDKAFFESHLYGLSQYYSYQSGGRLHIDARVLPEGDRDSYKLSDVADYGPGADGFWTIEGLERLVRDMIGEADAGTQADGSANLSDYDDDHPLTYIIFAHSGSDWQSDIYQDSPNDIPTFFVTLGEQQSLLGGGNLSECSVIPETTTQDGYLGSIAAALYHEFGHALGLPDVYDATTGYTSVGVWDLMDSGTNLAANLGYYDPEVGDIVGEPVTGVLPPSLSAWCKWFLGWVETGDLTGGEGEPHRLPAVGVPRQQYSIHNTVAGNDFNTEDPQVLVGGGSPGEFFLIENRWVPLSVEDTPYDPFDPGDPDDPTDDYGGLYLQTDATGVILFLGGSRRGVEGLNTGYYDYFMPEGGVLVWHANMDRIESLLEFNAINAYGDGLKLVEADGIQDVGVLDAYVLGWYGSYRDVFAPWNDVGYDELFVEGGGVPSSRAHDRSWTGVHVWDIADNGSAHGAVMQLMGAVEPLRPGWPVQLPPAGDLDTPAPRALDVASLTPLSDGARRLVLGIDAPATGTVPLLFAWDHDGAAAFPPLVGLPDGAAMSLPDRPVGPPAAVTLADGTAVVLVATADGTLQAVRATAAGMQVVFAVTVADSLVSGPQPVPLDADGPGLFCVVDATGLAHLVDESGLTVGSPVGVLGSGSTALIAPLRVAPDGGGARVLFVGDGGWRWQGVDAAGFVSGGAATWDGALDGPATLALLPDGQDQRLIIFGPGGLQGCWLLAPGGAWAMTEWPDPGDRVVCEPAVADLDGDGRLDVVAATARRLYAWQDNGVSLTGYPNDLANLFPLPDSTEVAGPFVVADLAAGPGNELAFATDRGHLFVLGAGGLPVAGTPFRFGGDAACGLAALPTAADRFTLALADAGGLSGPPLDRRLTHGRLALYDERILPGGDPATATWIGPGGGPGRTGWVGAPARVAGESPADDPAQTAAIFYPNPLVDRNLTVRFWSATDRVAELAIYNLQGELVLRRQLPSAADRLNEFTVDLDVASGLYVARLTSEKVAGRVESETRTVAVAR